MNTKWFKALLVFITLPALIYFVFFQIQTYLGEQALNATGLTRYSYHDALMLAKERKKYVLADMSAIWCPSCRKLDKEIFSDERVKQLITRHYIFTRLEYETDIGKWFMQQYNIKGFPTLLILDADANKIMQLPLTFDAELFVDYLNDFIDMQQAG